MASDRRKPVKASLLLGRLQQDVRSLNSSILIITQKMKYVVRNEKILGRNLMVLNKKLKALEEKILSGEIGFSAQSGGEEADSFDAKLEEANRRIAELEIRLQQATENMASKEELEEMHFVVDSINPLQFVTLEQAKDLLAGKPVKQKALKKKRVKKP